MKDAAEPVALLLSDQRMPGLDGVGFLARQRSSVPGAKRALLTAYADTDAAIAAINQSQVDYYLQKPWDPPEQQLYPIVDELLDDWRAHVPARLRRRPKVIGSRYMPTVHQIKDFLARNHVPYEFFDVEATDERGAESRALAEGVDAAAGDPAWRRTAAGAALADLARKVGLMSRPRATSTTSRSSAPVPAGWRPRCTRRRRD